MELLASSLVSLAMQAAVNSGGMYEAVGEHRFSPRMSQYEACQHAESKAKQLIVRAALGQTFATEQSSQCSDISGNASCDTHTFTNEADNGFISKVADREEVVQDWTCYVRIKASVKQDSERKQKIDPAFDFNTTLNKTAFISGDELSFAVQPNAQMYLYVFHFDPTTNQYTRIVPNARDPENAIDAAAESTFPRPGYRFRVSTPNNMTKSTQQLVFVGVQQPQNFNQVYHVAEFNKLSDNLVVKKRILKKGFIVMKGDL